MRHSMEIIAKTRKRILRRDVLVRATAYRPLE
jgi:hypothetical protein